MRKKILGKSKNNWELSIRKRKTDGICILELKFFNGERENQIIYLNSENIKDMIEFFIEGKGE